jgi:hypothetical protein
MRNQINKAIKHLRLEVEKGPGYFYFVHEKDGGLNAPSVMVPYYNHLSIERWVEEAESALKTHYSNPFWGYSK